MPRTAHYSHFGILFLAQGAWTSSDEEEIKANLVKVDLGVGGPGVFFSSFPTNCDLCNQTREIFEDLQGKNIGFYKIGGHDLDIFELPGIQALAGFFEKETRIKKMYFFQGGPVEVFGAPNQKRKTAPVVLRERLSNQRVAIQKFVRLLETGKFQEEVLYEIVRDYEFS